MSSPATQPQSGRIYRYYALFLLFLVYIFNFIDRSVMWILLPSVKAEFDLSDLQLGLLGGLAFAIFYTTMGIPIARYADKANRRNVIGTAIAIWSAMTVLCGAATNFLTLFLARMGVGFGEAGASPPAHSMISDYFAEKERATALAIYSSGLQVGLFFGLAFGGWLSQNFGWRHTFVIVGLPGLLLSLLIFATLREPVRGAHDAGRDFTTIPPFTEALRTLWRRKSFVYMSLGTGFHTFVSYGASQFMASLMTRIHDMPRSEIGFKLGVVLGLGGAAGMFFGGWLSDRLFRKTGDRRWYVWIPALTGLAAIPFFALSFMADNADRVFEWLLAAQILSAMFLAPIFAQTQGVAGPRMRATAAAILLFALNMIGLGMGPTTIGWVSDQLAPSLGVESLRYALVIGLIGHVVAGFLFYMAGRTLHADNLAARGGD